MSPAQVDGTVPEIRNHVVPHGRPHAVPTSKGVNAWVTASANGIGSSGTSHVSTVTGTWSVWVARATRWL